MTSPPPPPPSLSPVSNSALIGAFFTRASRRGASIFPVCFSLDSSNVVKRLLVCFFCSTNFVFGSFVQTQNRPFNFSPLTYNLIWMMKKEKKGSELRNCLKPREAKKGGGGSKSL